MKKLGNVLYITSSETYLALDGENVVVKKDEHTATRLPLHNLEHIVCFTWQGASPALMGACAERNIGLCFLTPNGRFQARVTGKVKGNVLLRKKQYDVSEQADRSVPIAASFLLGKIANCRKVIERAIRDHALLVDVPALTQASTVMLPVISMEEFPPRSTYGLLPEASESPPSTWQVVPVAPLRVPLLALEVESFVG